MSEWNGVETALLTRLEKYRLRPRKSHAGAIRGERLSPKKGLSIEFADYRHYSPGDDLRHLDWNALARLDKAHIRTYRDEEELPVYLLVDTSASMGFGDPPKSHIARSLAACAGYVGLCGSDAIYPVALGSKLSEVRAIRGRSGYRRLQEWLRALPEGESRLSVGIQRFAQSGGRAGMALILSDGLDPQLPESLRSLGGRKHEVLFIQILSEVDRDPDLEGDLRLIDAEDEGTSVEITATSAVLQEYKKRLQAHCNELQAVCKRIGAWYLCVENRDSLEEIMLKRLRSLGALA